MSTNPTIAHRPWADALHSGGRFVADAWDAAWAMLLLGIDGAGQVLRAHSEAISLAVLFGLVTGTAAFTRPFSKLALGPVYITELCLAVLVLTLGSLVARGKIALLPSGRTSRWIVYFILAYLAFGTLRLALDFATGASAGLLAMLRNFALIYYASFAVIGWLLLQRKQSRAVLRYLLAAVILASTITSLWTVITYAMGIVPSPDDVNVIDASVVIQGQAALFAMFAVLIIANLLRYGALPKNPLWRGATIVVFLLNVLFLYLSGHRSALVACAAGGAMMVVGSKINITSRIRWRWVLLVLVGMVAGWYLLASHLTEFTDKFKTLLAPLEETNAAWRAAFWFAVVLLWLTRPIFGVGFGHDFYDEDPLRMVKAEHYDPHNSYLAILARTGIVGFFFIAGASVLFLRLMIRLVRRSASAETVLLASCLLSCFVAIATFAAMNVTLESPYHAMFFWLFIGMGIALAEGDASARDVA